MTDPSSHSRRSVRIAVQLVGFSIGIALLVWAVRLALSEENRGQFANLANAPPTHIAGLLGLSIATIILNGLIFHRTLVPVRRLKSLDVVAVNAIATLLNYLPFKLSVISRIVIHNRRDKLPLGQIVGWLAAVGVGGLISFGPVALVSLWRGSLDTVWIAASGFSVVAVSALTIWLSRYFGGENGFARVERVSQRLHIPFARKLLSMQLVREAHQGLDMLSSTPKIAAVVGLRLGDLAVQAARFLVAASILSVAFSPGQAVLFAVVYFFIGVISPAGMLGSREGGTIAFAALLGMSETEYSALAPVILLVTATEAIAAFGMAGVSIAWLRPDRLLRLRKGSVETSAAESG